MLAVLAALVVFVLVVEPLLVLAHEIGHALVPVAQGRETSVFVGGDRGPTVTVGWLTVTIAPSGFLSPVTAGATVSEAGTDRWAMIVGTLSGPLVSLFATIVAWRIVQFASSGLLWWLSYVTVIYCGLQTFSTLAPYSGRQTDDGEAPFKTDGRIALELLLGRDPVLDDAKGRFQDPE